MHFMWKRRHIRRFLEINTILWRLQASRRRRSVRKSEGEAIQVKVSPGRSETSLVLCADHMCFFFFFFSTACVLQLGEQQQKRRWWPPEAPGPAPERRGPSYLSLSVNNSSSQRPSLAISGLVFSLTSFKDSK